MPDRFRVGIVGAGFGQQVHVPAFRADPRCQVLAICASSPERAARAADRLSIPVAHRDWRDLVASPEVDIVSISVPPTLQPEIAEAAASVGKHIFCEKPIAVDSNLARAMLDHVTATGVRHAVDFIFPEIEAFRETQRCITTGQLGTVSHVTVTWKVETRAYRLQDTPSWKLEPELGGGVLNSFGSHVLHYLEWFLGPITNARASLSGAKESRLTALLELQSGCEAAVSIACDAFGGTGHRIEIYGTNGRIVLLNEGADYAAGFSFSLVTREAEPRLMGAPNADAADGRIASTSRIVSRLVDSIGTSVPVTPSLHDGWRAAVLTDAIRESAAHSKVVLINDRIDT